MKVLGALPLAWVLMNSVSVAWASAAPYFYPQWGFPLPWARASAVSNVAWDVVWVGVAANVVAYCGVAWWLRGRLGRTRPFADGVALLGAAWFCYSRWGFLTEGEHTLMYGEWGLGQPVVSCLRACFHW